MRVTKRLVNGRVETVRFAEPGDVQVDAVLSNVSIGYRMTGHIADIACPRVQAQRETVKIAVFGKEIADVGGDPIKRADKAKSARGSWSVTWLEKTLDEYSFEVPIGDRERQNAEPVVDVDLRAAELAQMMILQDREKRVADMLTDTANLTQNTTLSGTTQWSDFTNSDPVSDIETGFDTVATTAFEDPNTLILGRQVYNKLRRHPSLLEFFKYKTGGLVTPAMMAEAFQIERVIIANAKYRSSNPGQSTSTGAYIWGKHAIVAYIPPSPAMMTPALCYQYVQQDIQTSRYREPENKQDIVGNAELSGAFITLAGAGYLIKNAVA